MKGREYLILPRYLMVLGFLILVQRGWAQPSNDLCVSATHLCAGASYSSSNEGATTDICAGCSDGATQAGNFCFELDNTVWFSFTTNSFGGDATVDVNNISCLAGAGNDNELQAVVIEATTPCDESTYTAVSGCLIGQANNFSLTASGLNPSTTYYIMIDGDINGSTNAAECDFEISVSGPGVDVNVFTTVTDEDCGASDGEIDVSTVTAGATPISYSLNGGAFQASSTFAGLTAGTYDVTVQDANGCLYYANPDPEVGVINGPTGGVAIVTNASCGVPDGQIEISGTTGGTTPYSYSLNGGTPQANNIFSGLPAGTYEVLITDANGCPFVISNIIVESTGGPTDANVNVTNASCDGSDGSIVVTPIGGQATFTYSLNGGSAQGNSTFNGLTAGTYDILITDANGCDFMVNNVVVDEEPGTIVPEVSLATTPSIVCQGQAVDVIATVTNGGSNTDYEFFVNGASVQQGPNDTYSSTFNDGDVISVTITSDANCLVTSTASAAIEVDVYPPETPTVTMTPDQTAICQGEVVTFTAEQTGCTTPVYDWYVNGLLQQSSTDSTFSSVTLPDGAMVFVDVHCGNPCSDTATSQTETISVIELNVDAGDDVQILSGESTQLLGSGQGNLTWTPPNGLSATNISNPVASPGGTTTYTLTAEYQGCTASDEVTVFVIQPVIIPGAITPNGDGKNDSWQIIRIENFPNAHVSIYDRWGQRIYNSIGYSNQNPWMGTYKGKKLPAATYYYVIDLKETGDEDLDLFMGYVAIIY